MTPRLYREIMTFAAPQTLADKHALTMAVVPTEAEVATLTKPVLLTVTAATLESHPNSCGLSALVSLGTESTYLTAFS